MSRVCDPSSNQDAIGSRVACVGIAAVGGGVPGAVLGGIIGWRVKADVWQDVPLGTHRVGISPVVTPRGLGLGLRF